MNHNTQPQQQSSILDSYESSENALMDSFKAAALKVTTLYKDSLVQNRKAYASGYQQALQDLYEFISSHPSTTVSQQDAFVTPTEHGLLPVQDLLAYARQRNAQLASDMGVSSSLDTSASSSPVHHSVSPQPQPSHSTSSTHSTTASFGTNMRSQQQRQPGFSDHPSNLDSTATLSPYIPPASQPTTSVPGVIGAAVKNAFHPFQIDPNTQFTFSLPSNYHPHGQPWYNSNNNNGNSHMYGSTNLMNGNGMETGSDGMPMEGLKRRMASNELTFMGRSLNSMNIDSNWDEPAMKRRTKRDD